MCYWLIIVLVINGNISRANGLITLGFSLCWVPLQPLCWHGQSLDLEYCLITIHQHLEDHPSVKITDVLTSLKLVQVYTCYKPYFILFTIYLFQEMFVLLHYLYILILYGTHRTKLNLVQKFPEIWHSHFPGKRSYEIGLNMPTESARFTCGNHGGNPCGMTSPWKVVLSDTCLIYGTNI